MNKNITYDMITTSCIKHSFTFKLWLCHQKPYWMLPLFEDLYMLRSTLETRLLFLILDPVLLLLNFLSKA